MSKPILDILGKITDLSIDASATLSLQNKLKGTIHESLRAMKQLGVNPKLAKDLDVVINKLERLHQLTNAKPNVSPARLAEEQLRVAERRLQIAKQIAATEERAAAALDRQRARAYESQARDALRQQKRDEATQMKASMDASRTALRVRRNEELEQERISAANQRDRDRQFVQARRGAIARLSSEIRDTEGILSFDQLTPRERTNAQRRLHQRQSQLDAIQTVTPANRHGFTTQSLTRTANNTITSQLQREIELRQDAITRTREQARAIDASRFSATKFGEQIGLAGKRFAAFVIGSAPLLIIANSFRIATQEALKFEKAQTRLSQILQINRRDAGKFVNTAAVSGQFSGVSASDILQGVDTLAQAGFQSTQELNTAIIQLSKVPLTATFGTIEETSEGLIALLRQFPEFNSSLDQTATIFDKINRVAADYAVEVRDIFEGLKRGGSVFEQTGGKFDDFLELFTLLRSRSRESAETIGVFFKSIGFRIFRESNQELLRELKVTATTLPAALKQLSVAFEDLFPSGSEGDPRAIRLAEKLAGLNQGGRFITLLNAIKDDGGKFQSTLFSAKGSFDADVIKRSRDIGVSLDRMQRSVDAFLGSFTQNEGLRTVVALLADLSNIIVRVSAIAQPALLPIAGLLAAIATPTIIQGIGGIGRKAGFFGGSNRSAFASSILPVDSAYTYNNRLVETNQIRRDRLLRPFLGNFSGNPGFAGLTNSEVAIFNRGVSSGNIDLNNLTPLQRNEILDRTVRDFREQSPSASFLSQFTRRDLSNNRFLRGVDRNAFVRASRSPRATLGVGIAGVALGGILSQSSNAKTRAVGAGVATGSSIVAAAPLAGPAAPLVALAGIAAGMTVAFIGLREAAEDAADALRKIELANISKNITSFEQFAITLKSRLDNAKNDPKKTSDIFSEFFTGKNTGFVEQEVRKQLLNGNDPIVIRRNLERQLGLDNSDIKPTGLLDILSGGAKKILINQSRSINPFIAARDIFDTVKDYINNNSNNQDISDAATIRQEKNDRLLDIITKENRLINGRSNGVGFDDAIAQRLNANRTFSERLRGSSRNFIDTLPLNIRNTSLFESTPIAIPQGLTSNETLQFLSNNVNNRGFGSFAGRLQQRGLGSEALLNRITDFTLNSQNPLLTREILQRLSKDSTQTIGIPTDIQDAFKSLSFDFNVAIEDIAKTLLQSGPTGLNDLITDKQKSDVQALVSVFESLYGEVNRNRDIIKQVTSSLLANKEALNSYQKQIKDNTLEAANRRLSLSGSSGTDLSIISNIRSRVSDILSNSSVIDPSSALRAVLSGTGDQSVSSQLSQDKAIEQLLLIDTNNQQALNAFSEALGLATQITDKFGEKLSSIESSLIGASNIDLSSITPKDINFVKNQLQGIGAGAGRAGLPILDFLRSGPLLEKTVSPNDLNKLADYLQQFGDLPIEAILGGSDKTATSKIVDEIRKSAGISLTAKSRSLLTGESESSAAANIRDIMDNARKDREDALQKEEEIRNKFNEAVIALSKSTEARIKNEESTIAERKAELDKLISFTEKNKIFSDQFAQYADTFATAVNNFDKVVNKFNENTNVNKTVVDVNGQVTVVTDIEMLKAREAKLRDAITKAIRDAFQGDININIPATD